ncbi:unnamed protein product [Penicillium manginii]
MISYNDECRQLLEYRAKKVGIEGNNDYQDLIKLLFKPDPPETQPGTDADSDKHCVYSLARVDSLRNVFGGNIQKYIRNSLSQLHETANNHPPEFTQSVWMKLPDQSMQDAVFNLNVGSASELAKILYPNLSQKLASFLWPPISKTSAERTQELDRQPSSVSLSANLPDDGKSLRDQP